MKGRKRLTVITLFILAFLFLFTGCAETGKDEGSPNGGSPDQETSRSRYGKSYDDQDYDDQDDKDAYSDLYDYRLDEDGSYTSKEDVMNYLVQYGRLPDNFITKKEARAQGWSGGSLKRYAPGKCIGGDRFGNYEQRLPDVRGRTYYECDIDTLNAKKRGAKRIIYSDDGNIYYTDDHYESFTLLYGDDDYDY